MHTPHHILAAHDLYDREILAHGFYPNMRDYFLLVGDFGRTPTHYWEYTFRGCVEAGYRLTLKPDSISFDDSLLRLDSAGSVPGFVWGVRSACSAEEGWECSNEEPTARAWAKRLSVPIWYSRIGTNVYELKLWFFALQVEPIGNVEQRLDEIWERG
jgi:hypothetical protein